MAWVFNPFTGNLDFSGSGGGGSTNPGGADTQIQFNDSTAFAGDDHLTWDKNANALTIGKAGGTSGTMKFAGTTSGVVTLKAADAAGTHTLTLPTADGDAGQYLQTDGSGAMSWATVPATASIGYAIDGGGVAITTGVAGPGIRIPFACTITEWTLLADTTGSITIDIWKDVIGSYPPTVDDTIIGVGGTKPNISNATNASSSTLTNWTTAIGAGDVLRFKVDSVTSITSVSLILKVTKS